MFRRTGSSRNDRRKCYDQLLMSVLNSGGKERQQHAKKKGMKQLLLVGHNVYQFGNFISLLASSLHKNSTEIEGVLSHYTFGTNNILNHL